MEANKEVFFNDKNPEYNALLQHVGNTLERAARELLQLLVQSWFIPIGRLENRL